MNVNIFTVDFVPEHDSSELEGVPSKGVKLFASFIANEGISDTSGELQELVHLSFFATRLETFNQCHMKLEKDLRDLVDAGFYYGGNFVFCCIHFKF